MSVTLLLAEAKARHPVLTFFIPLKWVLKALETHFFGKAARYYITEDRTKTLFVLRVKETNRQADRLVNMEHLKGFEPLDWLEAGRGPGKNNGRFFHRIKGTGSLVSATTAFQ
jgi:hypothetical protein